MNTTELTERLRGATDGLAPPPGFAETVLHGGRRRRARRRLTVAASVLAVVAVAGAATVVTLREDDRAPVADARLNEPTIGTLAGDQAFLGEVVAEWRKGLPYAFEASRGYYDDIRGEPHVYWAGDTPAGRAAIVLQQVYVHPTAEVTEKGLRTAEGLVATDPADDTLKLVSTRVIGQAPPRLADYFQFGPGDRTLVAIDEGEPLYYASRRTENGSVSLVNPRRLEPDGGVAFMTIPDEPWTAVVYEGSHPIAPKEVAGEFGQIPASYYLYTRLADPSSRPGTDLLRWDDTVWQLGTRFDMEPGQFDAKWGGYSYIYLADIAVSPWTIVAGLPGGRMIILKERQYRTAEPRLIAKTAPNATTETMDLIDGGVVDRDAVLPVRFQIPDGGGWIVADKGKEISYRTSPEAPWQKAGRDAALLPDGVTEVLAGDHYVRLQ